MALFHQNKQAIILLIKKTAIILFEAKISTLLKLIIIHQPTGHATFVATFNQRH